VQQLFGLEETGINALGSPVTVDPFRPPKFDRMADCKARSSAISRYGNAGERLGVVVGSVDAKFVIHFRCYPGGFLAAPGALGKELFLRPIRGKVNLARSATRVPSDGCSPR
jgi:hypothetical protein